MKIEVVDKPRIINEPESGSVVLVRNGDYHLVINLEDGFAVYDLLDNESFIFDDFEQYSNNFDIDNVYLSNEITIILQKENS